MLNHTNSAPEPQPEKPTPDIFSDLAYIRVDPTMADGPIVLKKILVQVLVQKPPNDCYFRTHPDTAHFNLDSLVLELKHPQETYLVLPRLREALSGEPCVYVKRLRLAVTRQNSVFIWPIRIPSADGRLDSWNESALRIAEMSASQWVRIRSNRELGFYEADTSSVMAEPQWPDLPFNELLRIAFKGKVIETLDHPVLKRLRGET